MEEQSCSWWRLPLVVGSYFVMAVLPCPRPQGAHCQLPLLVSLCLSGKKGPQAAHGAEGGLRPRLESKPL